MKYVKYFTSTILLVLAIYICTMGSYYPTYFFIGFSLLIILGDLFFGEDIGTDKYAYPRLINIPIYINLPLLLIFISIIIFVFGNHEPMWFTALFNNYLNIDNLLCYIPHSNQQ